MKSQVITFFYSHLSRHWSHARGMDFPTLARQRQREERLLRDLGLGAQSGTSSPDTKDAVTETAEETDA